jgi:Flp pilus assembly pilin Flp
MKWLRSFLRDEEGATSVEYAVMLAFVIVACYVGINAVGGANGNLWDNNSGEIGQALQ